MINQNKRLKIKQLGPNTKRAFLLYTKLFPTEHYIYTCYRGDKLFPAEVSPELYPC